MRKCIKIIYIYKCDHQDYPGWYIPIFSANLRVLDIFNYHLDLEKRGDSHLIVTRGSRVSRAPPHHILQGGLPAFLHLYGIINIHSNQVRFFRDSPSNEKQIPIPGVKMSNLKPGDAGF